MEEKRMTVISETGEVVDDGIVSMDQVEAMDRVFNSESAESLYFTPSLDFSDSRSDKLRLHKIKSKPDHRLKEYIGKDITVTGFMAHWVKVRNERTGKEEIAPRVIMIDDKGESYVAVSVGIMNAWKQVVFDIGYPSQEEPIVIRPLIEKGKHGFEFSSFEVISA